MSSSDVVGRAKIVIDPDASQFGPRLRQEMQQPLSQAATAASQAAVQIGQNLQRVGQSAQQVGRTMSVGLTLPIVAFGTQAVRAFNTFESNLAQIVGLVGIAADEVEQMGVAARDMAVEFGRGAAEASEALFFITSAGLRGADATEALEVSLRAAAVGLGDTATIADAVTSAVNAYSASGLTATRATDILTAAVREGKLEAEAIAPVLGRILPTASALGISFEQVAGQLAAFSRTGVDAAQGATTLIGIMSTLLKPSGDAAEVLGAAGLSMAELREQAAGPGGLIGVMRLLADTFAGNDEALARVFPNVEALRGIMNVLAQDAGTVDSVLQGVADSAGALDKAFEATAQTAQFRMDQALASVQDSFIEIGAVVGPFAADVLTALADGFATLADVFGSLPEPVQEFVVAMAAVAAVAGPVLVVAGSIARAMGAVALAFPGAASAFAAFRTGAAGTVTSFGAVAVAAAAVSEEVGKAASAMLGFPTDLDVDAALSDLTAVADGAQATTDELNRLAGAADVLLDPSGFESFVAGLGRAIGLIPLVEDPFDKFRAGFEAVDQQLAALVSSGDVETAQEQFRQFATRVSFVGVSANDLVREFSNYRRELGRVVADSGEFIDATAGLGTSMQDVLDLLANPEPGTEGLLGALEALADAFGEDIDAGRLARAFDVVLDPSGFETLLLGVTELRGLLPGVSSEADEARAQFEALDRVMLQLVQAGGGAAVDAFLRSLAELAPGDATFGTLLAQLPQTSTALDDLGVSGSQAASGIGDANDALAATREAASAAVTSLTEYETKLNEIADPIAGFIGAQADLREAIEAAVTGGTTAEEAAELAFAAGNLLGAAERAAETGADTERIVANAFRLIAETFPEFEGLLGLIPQVNTEFGNTVDTADQLVDQSRLVNAELRNAVLNLGEIDALEPTIDLEAAAVNNEIREVQRRIEELSQEITLGARGEAAEREIERLQLRLDMLRGEVEITIPFQQPTAQARALAAELESIFAGIVIPGTPTVTSDLDAIRALLGGGVQAAHGGLFTEATRALVGEAGPELVLPLTRPARVAELLAQAQSAGLLSLESLARNGLVLAPSFEGDTIAGPPAMLQSASVLSPAQQVDRSLSLTVNATGEVSRRRARRIASEMSDYVWLHTGDVLA